MTHGHASQEGEHASHHAHDPFDRRVAMSMVVIAAVLAAVKVLGHRTHNDTLHLQIQAGVAHTQESDLWNFFQSKKMREVLAKLEAELLLQEATRSKDAKPASKDDKVDWDRRAKRLIGDFEEIINPPERQEKTDPPDEAARKIVEQIKKRYEGLKKQGLTHEQAWRVAQSEEASARYRQESRYISEKANKLKQDAAKYENQSKHKHHQAFFFDLGELGVELALVLSSVAILTKRSPYWHAGIVLGIIGVGTVGVGFFVH